MGDAGPAGIGPPAGRAQPAPGALTGVVWRTTTGGDAFTADGNDPCRSRRVAVEKRCRSLGTDVGVGGMDEKD